MKILIISLLFSKSLFAQSFEGCGEYEFRGILKHDKTAPLEMSYVVNEGTKSQMVFHFTQREDVPKVALMVDLPSTLKASITKKMDGTKGVISFPTEIVRRFPDPLKNAETGIKKIKSFKCD